MRSLMVLSAALVVAAVWSQGAQAGGQEGATTTTKQAVWRGPIVKQLHSALKQDAATCVAQAQTLLASPQTTQPALREKIGMAIKCAQVAAKGDVSVAADFVDLFKIANANERAALFAFCPPLMLVKPWRGSHGSEAIDALQAAADAEGCKVPAPWAQHVSCFKMKHYIETGQVAQGIEILKRLPDMELSVFAEDYRKSSLHLGVGPRNALLRQASADQLEEVAAAMGRLAAAIETQCGQDPDAWALSADWKANAQRASQLAAVKRAAQGGQ